MKATIVDILKRTFVVVQDKNTTIVSIHKHPKKSKRRDGLYWLEIGKKSTTSIWRPTPICDIFTVFH